MLGRRLLIASGVATLAICCRLGYEPIDVQPGGIQEPGAGRAATSTGGAAIEHPPSAGAPDLGVGGLLGFEQSAGAGGGAPTAGSDPGPAACSNGSIVCEHFEGTSALMLVEVGVGGKLSFATSDPWQGTACLLCTATAETGARVVGTIPSKTSGELHARARFKIHSGGQVSGAGFAPLLAVHATVNDKLSFDLSADDLVSLVTPSATVQSAQPIPRDRWFCAGLSALVSSSSGWARLSIDGAMVAEITDVPTLLRKQAYGELWAGIEWFSEGSGTLSVEVDDLEYSELPLPCP